MNILKWILLILGLAVLIPSCIRYVKFRQYRTCLQKYGLASYIGCMLLMLAGYLFFQPFFMQIPEDQRREFFLWVVFIIIVTTYWIFLRPGYRVKEEDKEPEDKDIKKKAKNQNVKKIKR